MGGSLGLALRALAAPPRVVGYDPDPESSRLARQRGAVDAVSAGPGDAVADAELVALAAPPRAAAGLLESLEPRIPGRAVVADLSSVMRPLLASLAARPALSGRVVSSHPLCGSERDGIEAARPDLYRGSTVLIGATEAAGEAAVRVAEVWRSLGAEPRLIDPKAHDALLALTSHLPFLGSVALVRALRGSGRSAANLAAASGPGLKDTTRLAGSSPALWEEILLLNADELAPAVRLLEGALGELRGALETGGPALRSLLEEAGAFRAELQR